jgi:16S rRNA (cytosine967-C5)-methyltransferase
VVAYVTCSPHLAETRLVVDDVLRRRDDAERCDAREVLRSVLVPGPDIDLGAPDGGAGGLDAQLWPHVHGTDAMHLTLLRRTA